MYRSALVKTYLLLLQGEERDVEKATLCGLLPRDPDDTVGHRIVLKTKATHLDRGQSPSFPADPFFFFRIPAPHTVGPWWDWEVAWKSEGGRLTSWIIYGIAKPPSVHSD